MRPTVISVVSQPLHATVKIRLDSSASHRSCVLNVRTDFLPHFCKRPAHRACGHQLPRLDEIALSAVRERRVSDAGGEEKQLHQAFGAVDGSLAWCCERSFNDRVDEIEAPADLGYVRSLKALDEDAELEAPRRESS